MSNIIQTLNRLSAYEGLVSRAQDLKSCTVRYWNDQSEHQCVVRAHLSGVYVRATRIDIGVICEEEGRVDPGSGSDGIAPVARRDNMDYVAVLAGEP